MLTCWTWHRAVKDHIFFDLDQRSRSLHQRSRSLLKDQDHWQWSRSITRSRSLLKKTKKKQQNIQINIAHFYCRYNSKVQWWITWNFQSIYLQKGTFSTQIYSHTWMFVPQPMMKNWSPKLEVKDQRSRSICKDHQQWSRSPKRSRSIKWSWSLRSSLMIFLQLWL